MARYIVTASSASTAAAEVARATGEVVSPLPLVQGVDARLSAAAVRILDSTPGLHVTPDAVMRPLGITYQGSSSTGQLGRMDVGSLWSPGGGSGVGVALIDTGVTVTPGLTASRVVYSPDFSGRGGVSDGFGHGTFMAGLIAGNGEAGPEAVAGVAPGVTLVSVKVGADDGSTTLSRVIEGIAWAIDNRRAYNIRVMSLSFGADLSGGRGNPLDLAVEAAWASGITVVAAAGNQGAGSVPSPGDDPRIITVGAETTTGPVVTPSWSGSTAIKPDVVAPGTSVVSLRDPGSAVDRTYPTARVGEWYFVGSGTSMSTALTAGAAALMVADHPSATPDQVKKALVGSASEPSSGSAGPIDVTAADSAVVDGPGIGTAQENGHASRGPGSAPGQNSWDSMQWDSMHWDSMQWDSMHWDSMQWDSMHWDSMHWDSMHWDSVQWDGSAWSDAGWGR